MCTVSRRKGVCPVIVIPLIVWVMRSSYESIAAELFDAASLG
jgi:hypothetical protein